MYITQQTLAIFFLLLWASVMSSFMLSEYLVHFPLSASHSHWTMYPEISGTSVRALLADGASPLPFSAAFLPKIASLTVFSICEWDYHDHTGSSVYRSVSRQSQ